MCIVHYVAQEREKTERKKIHTHSHAHMHTHTHTHTEQPNGIENNYTYIYTQELQWVIKIYNLSGLENTCTCISAASTP